MVKSACVYCGASNKVADIYKKAAITVGTALAEADIQLVYGGGKVGLMGLAANAVLSNGGKAIGIIPEHLQTKEIEHKDLTELHIVDSMHTRKQMMVDKSDAFIMLPGGLGTLDETFEILTWKMLGLHDKPVIIVNIDGYSDKFVELIDSLIDKGFARPEHKTMFRIITDPSDVVEAIKTMPKESFNPELKWK